MNTPFSLQQLRNEEYSNKIKSAHVRLELEKFGLSPKGSKAELVDRLKRHLQSAETMANLTKTNEKLQIITQLYLESDFILVCKDGIQVPATKKILVQSSPFFEALFSSDAMKLFVFFCASGSHRTDLISSCVFIELIRMAHFFQLKESFIQSINFSNALLQLFELEDWISLLLSCGLYEKDSYVHRKYYDEACTNVANGIQRWNDFEKIWELSITQFYDVLNKLSSSAGIVFKRVFYNTSANEKVRFDVDIYPIGKVRVTLKNDPLTLRCTASFPFVLLTKNVYQIPQDLDEDDNMDEILEYGVTVTCQLKNLQFCLLLLWAVAQSDCTSTEISYELFLYLLAKSAGTCVQRAIESSVNAHLLCFGLAFSQTNTNFWRLPADSIWHMLCAEKLQAKNEVRVLQMLLTWARIPSQEVSLIELQEESNGDASFWALIDNGKYSEFQVLRPITPITTKVAPKSSKLQILLRTPNSLSKYVNLDDVVIYRDISQFLPLIRFPYIMESDVMNMDKKDKAFLKTGAPCFISLLNEMTLLQRMPRMSILSFELKEHNVFQGTGSYYRKELNGRRKKPRHYFEIQELPLVDWMEETQLLGTVLLDDIDSKKRKRKN